MISDTVLQKIKLHYSEEYQKTLIKLKELEAILSELGEVDVSYTTLPATIVESSEEKESTAISPKPKPEELKTEAKPAKRAYKKRAKKRGRKSVWGSFVLKRLKATQKPLSYDDLANHAIVVKKLNQSDFDKIRKSIIGAVFNLRTKQDKLATVSKNGTRDKYVLLKSWVDDNNKMLPEFKEKV